MAAGLQDEITGDDQVAHEGRGHPDGCISCRFPTGQHLPDGCKADFHVADQAAAEYPCALAYLAAVAGLPCGVVRNQPAEVLRQQGIVAVHGLHVRFLCRQAVVNEDVPSSAFAHDMEFRAVAEGGRAGHGNGVRMEDDAARGDVVMGDIPVDVGYQTVVAHGGTVQRGMADTRMERDSARQRDGLLEIPDTVGAGKCTYARWRRSISDGLQSVASFRPCSLAVPVVGFRWEAVVGMQCRYASVVPCLFYAGLFKFLFGGIKKRFFLKVSEVCLIFLQDTPDGEGCEVHTVGGRARTLEAGLCQMKSCLKGVGGFILRQMIFCSAPNEKSFAGDWKIICRRFFAVLCRFVFYCG